MFDRSWSWTWERVRNSHILWRLLNSNDSFRHFDVVSDDWTYFGGKTKTNKSILSGTNRVFGNVAEFNEFSLMPKVCHTKKPDLGSQMLINPIDRMNGVLKWIIRQKFHPGWSKTIQIEANHDRNPVDLSFLRKLWIMSVHFRDNLNYFKYRARHLPSRDFFNLSFISESPNRIA